MVFKTLWIVQCGWYLDGGMKQMLLGSERQQTMMSLVSDKAFVFQPEVTEKPPGGY